MNNTKVIICDLDHADIEEEKTVFESAGFEFKRLRCKTQKEVIRECKGAAVLLNQYVLMDRKIFEALPEVKCIVRYGVGVDNINLRDAAEFGVQICNVPDYGTREVADQALALMMALTRKVVLSSNLIRGGIWDYQKGIPIHRFSEATIGICGVGRIGSEFAKRARSLGSKIIAYDIEYTDKRHELSDFIEFVKFDELLELSDIISIHCPLDESTYHMFSANEFNKMKNKAYIINTARGGIIDEAALLKALENNEIAGAALDVVENEPMRKNDPLLAFDNFIVTPHTSWYSEQSSRELKRKAAEEAVRFLNGEKVHYPVNFGGNL